MSETFGERLKRLREQHTPKLTLEKLAEKIGSTKSYIWELENKDSIRPSADTVYKLAQALNVTVEELQAGTSPKAAEEVRFFRKYKELDQPTQRRLEAIMDALKAENEGK